MESTRHAQPTSGIDMENSHAGSSAIASLWDSHEEAAFYRGTTYPAKKFAEAAPVPSSMLHCALFKVTNRKIAYVERVHAVIPISSGGTLEYKGAELRQAEGMTFAMLCRLSAGKSLGQWLTLDPASAVAEMGWGARTGVEKLAAALDRLQDSALKFFSKEGYHRLSCSLVLEWRRKSADEWEVRLPGSLSPEQMTWVSGTTHLNMQILAVIPEGLASWLYAFTAANACSYSFKLSVLQEHCGSSTGTAKEFGRQVRESLDALKDAGAIKGYSARRGTVAIYK